MLVKTIAISLALAQSANTFVAGVEYWKNFKTQVDPTNITIPKIDQTTSLDPTAQCQYYTPQNFEFDQSQWPNAWEIATSNGMNETEEFKNLYNSIDWDKAPKNVSVRVMLEDGSVDMSDYDENEDPDCWWSATTCTVPKHKDVNADIYACPEPETWGLTYDDGPNCSHNAFYDFLEQNKLKATMFYIGSNVVDWPYGAMRGIKDGHHIADHTWSHQMMTTLSNEEVLAELYYTQKAIKLATGITPKHWRPAYGDVDDRVRWIATQLNLTTVLWNLDTDDWAAGESVPKSTVEKTYQDFVEMGNNGTFATSGNIVLTHEIDNTTMQLALDYLPKIQKAYDHVLDVATCMNITHPYIEETISFPSFSKAVSSNSTASASASSSSAAKSSGSVASGTTKQGAADPSSSSMSEEASGESGASSIVAAVPITALIAAVSALFF
ncbi:chitin deacetylase [Lichtheimia corymbifera JMRC:FSU:9682]|uniref:chitin deacetylase n=1 Tax=Lichtheimia corymbifera JMRC:FSU:9682 TaxID=1263082 RepID=A0A068RYL5_9FUNG|nr:chitin deacetylase [Lichtheimia corymbifera JMRC:FSU:9682]